MYRARAKLGVSERRACSVIGQSRSSQRRAIVKREDEDALTQAIIRLAGEYVSPCKSFLIQKMQQYICGKTAMPTIAIWKRMSKDEPMISAPMILNIVNDTGKAHFM